MNVCPRCTTDDSRVLETRRDNDGDVYRRRKCKSCGSTWHTRETQVVVPGGYIGLARTKEAQRRQQ